MQFLSVKRYLSAVSVLSAVLLFTGCSVKHQGNRGESGFSFYPGTDGGGYIPGESGGFSSSSSRAQSGTPEQRAHKGQGTAAMHRATLRSYTVLGETYHPQIAEVGSDLYGIASWYGPDFHGKQTSSGEVYNMYDMTAAHKTLPMHTIVEVTHRESGKKITVRINDRGPFVEGRIIDLSYTAGVALGLNKTGTAAVKVKVLGYDDYITAKLNGPTASSRSFWCSWDRSATRAGRSCSKRTPPNATGGTRRCIRCSGGAKPSTG